MTKMHPTTRFSEKQLDALRVEYAKIATAPTSFLPRFHAMFDRCNDEALKQLASGKIKFVSPLALNACTRRGISL